VTAVCPITYEDIEPPLRYSDRGLALLAPRLAALRDFPYSAEQQVREAVRRAGKISVQGVQPKLSARLSVRGQQFVIVDRHGQFIIKPQNALYAQLPENEDLTMRLARASGIACPLHGLVHCSDGSLSYFIKRFDRHGRSGKTHVEDFAQLAGRTRETKYDSSMEQVARIVEERCSFPVPQLLELFRRTLFCLLTGNEDMHLKNFTVVRRDPMVELSPAYDMVNTTLAMGTRDPEELALPLNGRKRNITRTDLIGYFAGERLRLPGPAVQDVLSGFRKALPAWHALIDRSFLSPQLKQGYRGLVDQRAARFLG